MVKQKKTKKTPVSNYHPNRVTFGIALLAGMSIFALAILLFTVGR